MTVTSNLTSETRRAVANLATVVAIITATFATIGLGATLSQETDPHRYMTHAAIVAVVAVYAACVVAGLLILARWARTATNAS
jgi:O-antigen/teichoic acid export membrane protein